MRYARNILIVLAGVALGPLAALATQISVPSALHYGDVLIGQTSGNYTRVATSTLGLPTWAYPFTATSWGMATTSEIGMGGLISTASSTFTGGAGNATTTFDQGIKIIASGSVSNSTSVGGLVNLTNTNNDGAGLVIYTANGSTATGGPLVVRVNNTAFATQAVDIEDTSDVASAINLSAAPSSLGAFKWAANAAGNTSSAGISLDASTGSYVGQALFVKCAKGNGSCVHFTDSSSNNIFTQLGGGFFGIGNNTPTDALDVGTGFAVSTTTLTTTLTYASTTAVSGTALCIGSDCRTSWGGGGTVTSVDMSVPTGLTISGNPVTTSGTLALGLAAGYIIPLTASTTNWNSAYDGWNASHSNWDTAYTDRITAAGYPLSISSNVLSVVATSSENCTTSCFKSANVSQWTNDAGYLADYDAFTHPSYGGAATTSLMTMAGLISTASSTFTGATTTVTGSFALGTDNIGVGYHAFTFVAPSAIYSTSDSVGGAVNWNFNHANDGFHIAGNSGATNLNVDCYASSGTSQCVRIESSDTADSVINLQGKSSGLGLLKISASGDQGTSGALISLDASTNSNTGQALFAKCAKGNSACVHFTDAGSANIFTLLGGGYFGIGNNSPTDALDVGSTFSVSTTTGTMTATYASTTALSSTGSAYFATAGGNVGIGTTNPGSLLEVDGTTTVQSLRDTGNLYWRSGNTSLQPDGSPYYGIGTSNVDLGGGTTKATRISDYYGLLLNVGGTDLVALNDSGNVGIGTTNPGQKLDVNGTVLIEGSTGTLLASSTFQAMARNTSVNCNFIGTSTAAMEQWIDGGQNSTNCPSAGISGAVIQFMPTDFGAYVPNEFQTQLFDNHSGNNQDFYLRNNNSDSWSHWYRLVLQDFSTGRVGIGTTTPVTDFSLTGNAYLTGGLGVGLLNTGAGTIEASGNIVSNANVESLGTNAGLIFQDRTSSQDWEWYGNGAAAHLWNGTGDLLTVLSDGNVGIGTSSPDTALTYYGAAHGNCVSLTDGSTITIDWSLGNCFYVTLGASRTLAFTNVAIGQSIKVFVTNGGSDTLTYPSAVVWPAGTAPTLATTAGHWDVLVFSSATSTQTISAGANDDYHQ